ncbi:hypothetical protein [Sneathiella glossodoripedis]|uniref:hypothetical protein n=1 Tax=Sneathiella glossodoripedis TaxID=418853 RepID=UPI00046FC5E9|nr:hypothetical protein [Sneathiella glossodoripedis]
MTNHLELKQQLDQIQKRLNEVKHDIKNEIIVLKLTREESEILLRAIRPVTEAVKVDEGIALFGAAISYAERKALISVAKAIREAS